MGIFGEDAGNMLWIGAAIVLLIGGLIFFLIFARYFRLYIQSVTTGAGIGIFDLLGMTFRKVNPTVIVRSKIMAVQSGLERVDTGITSKIARSPLSGWWQCAARHSGDHRRQQSQND